MNDGLDTLRSFRPEATGPTAALQLQERNAFMEALAETPTPEPPRMSRLRRRRSLVLVIAIALVVAVGTAGAAGLVPDDVQQALGLAAEHSPDAALTPEVDQAVEQTSAPTADGGTLELWTAPTTGGGTCAYLRQLDPSGAPADSGPISCAASIAGGGRMGEAFESSSPGHAGGSTITAGGLGDGGSTQVQVDSSGAATMFGQAPGSVAEIEVVDAGGAVLAGATMNNGWFLLTLTPDAASAAASIVEESAAGASLSTRPFATAPPAPRQTGASSGA